MRKGSLLLLSAIVALVVVTGCTSTASQMAPAPTPTAQMAPPPSPADAMPKDDSNIEDGMMQAEPASDLDAKDAMEKDKGSTPEAMPGDTMKKEQSGDSSDAMMAPESRYIDYTPKAFSMASQNGRVVLFFKADWCPTCRSADADFRASLDKIPADVTVLRVNYDTESALKNKYRITYQHTFVQVDANGNEVTRWNGGGTDELLASIA
jgi:thioredoxin 1